MASSKPIIVLVPGAFHRPSSWDAVATRLRDRGFTVVAPPLFVAGDAAQGAKLARRDPLDDVLLIHEVLRPLLEQDAGHEAIIVSHSYGSVPASLAIEGWTVAEREAQGLKGGIRATVTIAGFAYPVRNKGYMGDESEAPLMPYHVLEDGVVYLQEAAKALWYSDLDVEGQDKAWGELWKAQSRASFTHFPSFITADVKIPKTFVLCEQDKAVDPKYQEMTIQIGKYDKVVRLPSGHAPMFSKPEEVAKIIAEAAGL